MHGNKKSKLNTQNKKKVYL